MSSWFTASVLSIVVILLAFEVLSSVYIRHFSTRPDGTPYCEECLIEMEQLDHDVAVEFECPECGAVMYPGYIDALIVTLPDRAANALLTFGQWAGQGKLRGFAVFTGALVGFGVVGAAVDLVLRPTGYSVGGGLVVALWMFLMPVYFHGVRIAASNGGHSS